MTFALWYTLILFVIMSIALIKEWLEAEIIVFSTLVLLMVGKVISVKEAFAGFSNEGMLTIGLLFVVAGSLSRTGMITQINHLLFGKNKTGPSRKLLRILFPISALSAFMNNTPLVAMLIPAVRSWTEKNHHAPSKFLIPISYAAILGGTCTLIGTSTNLVVHGLMIEHGMAGLDFFEISLIGVPIAIVGILFVSLIGHRLLPARKEPIVKLGEMTREFVIELKVTEDYEHIGKTVTQAGLRQLTGLFLFQIDRESESMTPASPNATILLNDRLFFTGIPKTIIELQKTAGLQLIKDATFDLKQYDSSHIKAFEAAVSTGSPLVGKTVRGSNFRKKYEAVIIAIHRHGERIQKKIGDITLRSGDTLLLLAGKDFRRKWYHSKDFYLISEAVQVPSKPRWQGYLSVSVFLMMIILTVSGIMPLISASALASMIVVATGCVTPSEARRLIDWRVLVIIASAFGMASALENSGLAEKISFLVVSVGQPFGVLGILSCLYATTSLFTTIISNNAAAALLFPVAVFAATSIQAEVRPFMITLIIAAGASFMTPISYQTNLMVYGPGGYKYSDFIKIGLPLQLIVGIIGITLIYQIYF